MKFRKPNLKTAFDKALRKVGRMKDVTYVAVSAGTLNTDPKQDVYVVLIPRN